MRQQDGPSVGSERPAGASPVQRHAEPASAGKRTLVEGLAPAGELSVQQRAADAGGAPGDTSQIHAAAEHGVTGSGGALPHGDTIQRLFGRHDVSGVSAHVGGPAAEASRAMGAEAYASGSNVAFARSPDLHTAAHEAAHVVQQRGGVQLRGGVGAVGDPHERHADAVADQVVRGASAEPLLDQYAPAHGSAMTVQRAVQQLATPIVGAAPATAITIRAFIDLVRGEEARWPVAEQTQTALMITRIRKIFYGTEGWDTHLIPGAAATPSGYNISEEETGRENLSLDGPDADIVRKRQVTTDGAGHTPAIASQQEVKLEDGTFCDVGHVFAGLDAANHPSAVSAPLGIATVSSNLAATTWVGDLGSVAGEVMFDGFNSGSMAVPGATAQAEVDEYAPPQDLLGNIDAYVMADQYDTSDSAGVKVSDLLARYYLGAAASSDGRARLHRYSRYAGLVGLTGWSGSAFSNEAAWLDTWAPQVGAAAALYIGANTAGFFAMPGRLGTIVGIQNAPIVRQVLRAYLADLKARVAAEPP